MKGEYMYTGFDWQKILGYWMNIIVGGGVYEVWSIAGGAHDYFVKQ